MKTTAKRPYVLERKPDVNNVLSIRFEERVHSGFEAWFLLCSDRHWDNPMSDRAMQRRHLEEARKRNAGIIDAGDLFCAMQGRDDKRGSKSSVRREHMDSAYFDTLVNSAAKWFAPWADLFVSCSPGNHETAVTKRHETNITERFVTLLNSNHGGNCNLGTYCGWIRFVFKFKTSSSQIVNMFYHHGWGGGGPVTRGVIDTNRMAVYLPEANLIWTGHTHDSWLVPISRARLSIKGTPFTDEAVHFRTPGYKDEFGAMEGFHIEKGRGPKPIGGVWLHFRYINACIEWEILRAT